MVKTQLRANLYGMKGVILVSSDREIDAKTLEEVRRLRGVEQAFASRYELRVFIGVCFDEMEVATSVRKIVEKSDD